MTSPPRPGGWPAGRLVLAGIAVMAVFSVAAILIGALAVASLGSARNKVVNNLDPASFQGSQLEVALLNQETGVRGYALSGNPVFLQPYTLGRQDEPHVVSRLRQVLAGSPQALGELNATLAQAADWRTHYALPVIAAVKATGEPLPGPSPLRGKADFDAIRAQLTAFQKDISAQRRQALTGLADAADTLNASFVGIAAGLLLLVVLLTVGVDRAAIRPLARLAADARQVAGGDFGHALGRTGPQEVRDLGLDVDEMRARILAELAAAQTANTALEDRTRDLQRSNAELEQFAYVASHDLQEPLRKVASFCQLLQRRYGGQLDEKADQYIEYAVDGAKRMQMLINDLLAFSRVGRMEQQRVAVGAGQLLAQAQANLATVLRRSRARVEAGDLPVVLAEPTLLTAVFQNLLSNAIKFRGEPAPVVTVTARREGDRWEFSFADNGIGVSPEYAERIFVIFQRLHDKATYPGTGIGLAMTRKIIEYHGGRIWLDTTATAGARFCFTLPVIEDKPPAVPDGDSPGLSVTPDEFVMFADTDAAVDAADTDIPEPAGVPDISGEAGVSGGSPGTPDTPEDEGHA